MRCRDPAAGAPQPPGSRRRAIARGGSPPRCAAWHPVIPARAPRPRPVVRSRCGRARCPHRAAAPSARCAAWRVAHAESFACRGSVRGTVRGRAAHPARCHNRAAITHAKFARALHQRITPAARWGHRALPPLRTQNSPAGGCTITGNAHYPRPRGNAARWSAAGPPGSPAVAHRRFFEKETAGCPTAVGGLRNRPVSVETVNDLRLICRSST